MKCRRTQWAVIVIVIIAITIYLIVARHKIDVYHYVRSLGFATVTSNYSDGEPTVMCAYPPPTSTNVIAILVPPNDFTDIAARLSQLDVRFVDNC